MRAVIQRATGEPDVLEVADDVPTPTPGPTEVRVKVAAAGVNPTDWKRRRNDPVTGEFRILGFDVSGHVDAVGEGVTLFAPGDAVCGLVLFPHEASAYAEYVVCPARQLIRRPDALDAVTAGGLPLAALTAWQMITDAARLRSGERVLVHSGAGGVGHFAVQIARSLGCVVAATVSSTKIPTLQDLGCDHPIDYAVSDFRDAARESDVVLDPLGGDVLLASVGAVRPGGRVVTLPPNPAPQAFELAARRGVTLQRLLVEPDRHGLLQVGALVDSGRLRVLVEDTFDGEHAAAAHARGEQGHLTGKLILDFSSWA